MGFTQTENNPGGSQIETPEDLIAEAIIATCILMLIFGEE